MNNILGDYAFVDSVDIGNYTMEISKRSDDDVYQVVCYHHTSYASKTLKWIDFMTLDKCKESYPTAIL